LTAIPPRPQPPPVGSFLLLAAAALFYVPMLLAIWLGPPWGDPASVSGEGRLGEAAAMLFALLFGTVLWLALGGLLLLARRRGHSPPA
jgi:hypothetical protein